MFVELRYVCCDIGSLLCVNKLHLLSTAAFIKVAENIYFCYSICFLEIYIKIFIEWLYGIVSNISVLFSGSAHCSVNVRLVLSNECYIKFHLQKITVRFMWISLSFHSDKMFLNSNAILNRFKVALFWQSSVLKNCLMFSKCYTQIAKIY